MKHYISILLTLLLIFILSECKSIIPASNHPEIYFTFVLYSVPIGSAVYQVDADDSLVAAIGTTPFTWKVGVSVPHFIDGSIAISALISKSNELIRFWTNAPGIRLSNEFMINDTLNETSYWYDFLLNCALVNDNYNTSFILDKIIASIGVKNEVAIQYPPENRAMIVHLQPIINK
jgi:hypothetical protein